MHAIIRRFGYQSDFARHHFSEGEAEGEARGQAQGEARGKAWSLLEILTARGIEVDDDLRQQITTDTDRLDTWVRRAATATTIDDLFA